MIYCTKCGKQNLDNAKFCTGCGKTLANPQLSPTQRTTIPDATSLTTPLPAEKRKSTWVIVVLLLLGLAAGAYFIFFNNKKNNSATVNATSADSSTTDNEEKNGNERSASVGLTEPEIFSFLNDWLNAQNNKNMVTYSNFYSQEFQGIKRIKSGQVYYYNHNEWINDRTKMYTSAKNLIMTVSNVRITDHSDNKATVNFTHGYSSDAYQDIGEKQIYIEITGNGRISITKEEMLDSNDPSTGNTGQESYIDNEDKLVYKSDCFIIVTGSFSYEVDVKQEVKKMKARGYPNAGYLWIPDYPSLSGKQFYAPFIGPFQTYADCENNLRTLQKTGSYWYGKKVSFDNTKVEIRL